MRGGLCRCRCLIYIIVTVVADPVPQGDAVVELGCSYGKGTVALARSAAARVLGVDCSEEAIAAAVDAVAEYHHASVQVLDVLSDARGIMSAAGGDCALLFVDLGVGEVA